MCQLQLLLLLRLLGLLLTPLYQRGGMQSHHVAAVAVVQLRSGEYVFLQGGATARSQLAGLDLGSIFCT